MSEKSKVRCTTPRCINDIANYGENYHDVYDRANGPHCERCGGKWNGFAFAHVCKTCNKEVEPGALVGLFVPHNCAECQQKVREQERAQGRICRRCNSVFSDCCC